MIYYGILSFVGTARELLDYLASTQAKIDWQEARNKIGLAVA